jgi:hypothetical protein
MESQTTTSIKRLSFESFSMTMIMTMLMMVMMIWQVRMRRINPLHSFRILNRFQIRQIHCYSFAITPVFSVSNRPSKLQTEQRRGRMKRISKQHPSSSFQFPRTKQTPPLLPIPLKQQQTKPKENPYTHRIKTHSNFSSLNALIS